MTDPEPTLIAEQRTNGMHAYVLLAVFSCVTIGTAVTSVFVDRVGARVGFGAFALIAAIFVALLLRGIVRPRYWRLEITGPRVRCSDSYRPDALEAFSLSDPPMAEVIVEKSGSVSRADETLIKLVRSDGTRWLVPGEVYSNPRRFVRRLERFGFAIADVSEP